MHLINEVFMNKEQIKKKLPNLYRIWHVCRVRRNKIAERRKKEAYDRYGQVVLFDLFKMIIQRKYNITCYYGTLLGLVRDDCLIPWDDDLDFVIFSHNDFEWVVFERDMVNVGFKKFRTMEIDNCIIGQSYKKKGVLCDFFIKELGYGNVESIYGCYQIPGKEYINGQPQVYKFWKVIAPKTSKVIKKLLSGVDVLIPENYEDVLRAYYGEKWNIPDPNFVPDREEIEVQVKITYH